MNNITTILKFLLIAPLLMAFQCEEELGESSLVINEFQVAVTPEWNFSLDDTIWVSGRLSSKALDLAEHDSVFLDTPPADVFSLYQFIEPTALSNCQDAIDQFVLIMENGTKSFIPSCENAHLQALPELESNGLFYNYRIGLIPTTTGDYVISWQSGILQNLDRNEFIIDAYLMENHPGQIGFNSCGNHSWRYLNESEREYYFRVR